MMEIIKYVEMNDSENTVYGKLYHAAKAAPRGRWIALSSHTRETTAGKQRSNILSQEIRKRKAN